MRTLRAWLLRLAGVSQRTRAADVTLAAELDSHLQLHIDDNVRAGMTPDEARRDAHCSRWAASTQTDESIPRSRAASRFFDTLLAGPRLRRARAAEKSAASPRPPSSRFALGIGANTRHLQHRQRHAAAAVAARASRRGSS